MIRTTCSTVVYALDHIGEAVLVRLAERCKPRFGEAIVSGLCILVNKDTPLPNPASDYGFVRVYDSESDLNRLMLNSFQQELISYHDTHANVGGLRVIAIGDATINNLNNFNINFDALNSLIKHTDDYVHNKGELQVSIEDLLSQLREYLDNSHKSQVDGVFVSLSKSDQNVITAWENFKKGTSSQRRYPFSHYTTGLTQGEYVISEQERTAQACLLSWILCFEVGGHRTYEPKFENKAASSVREELNAFFHTGQMGYRLYRVLSQAVYDGTREAIYQDNLEEAKGLLNQLRNFKNEDITEHEDIMLRAMQGWNRRLLPSEIEENTSINFKKYLEKRQLLRSRIERLITHLVDGSAHSSGLLKRNPEDVFKEMWLFEALKAIDKKVKELKQWGEADVSAVIEDLKRQYDEEIPSLRPVIGRSESTIHKRYSFIGHQHYTEKLKDLKMSLGQELTIARESAPRFFVHQDTYLQSNAQFDSEYPELDARARQNFEELHKQFCALSGGLRQSIFSKPLSLTLSFLAVTLLVCAFCENVEWPPTPRLPDYVHWVNYYALIAGFLLFKYLPIFASLLTVLVFAWNHLLAHRKRGEEHLAYQSRLGLLRGAIADLVYTSKTVVLTQKRFEERCERFVTTEALMYQRELDRHIERVSETGRCLKYLDGQLNRSEEGASLVDGREEWTISSLDPYKSPSRVEQYLIPPQKGKLKKADEYAGYSSELDELKTQRDSINPWETMSFSIDNVTKAQDYFLWVEKFVQTASKAEVNTSYKHITENENLISYLYDFMRSLSLGEQNIQSLELYGFSIYEKLKALGLEHTRLKNADYSVEGTHAELYSRVLIYELKEHAQVNPQAQNAQVQTDSDKSTIITAQAGHIQTES